MILYIDLFKIPCQYIGWNVWFAKL